jgi:Protein of unknown function (DUF3987)
MTDENPQLDVTDGTYSMRRSDGALLEASNVYPGRGGQFFATLFACSAPGEQPVKRRIDLLSLHGHKELALHCATLNGHGPEYWLKFLSVFAIAVMNKHREGDPAPRPTTPQRLPFPLEVLPRRLHHFVQTCAQALPCPPDFVAVPLLAALGATIGTTSVIEIKPGWRESTRIWVAVVAEPGSKKSPALDLVMRPLYAMQQALHQGYLEARAHYDRARLEYDRDLAEWKRGKRHALTVPPEKPTEPSFGQIVSTDATLEALAVVLEQNPRGLLFVRDELTGWARSMDQYKGNRGGDRQSWLSFWNGAQVVVNRKSRKGALLLNDPFVCVAGCLPPDVLADLGDEQGREDGFVHRILFAYSDAQTPRWTEQNIPQDVQADYAKVVQALRQLTAPEDTPAHVVHMTSEARAAFVEWVASHYQELAAGDLLPALRGPWAKLEGYCARFALILHLAARVCGEEGVDVEIDARSILGAAALVDYFKSHAAVVYGRLHASPNARRVEMARAWIARHGGEVTLRDLYRYKVAGCETPRLAAELLDLLVEHGVGSLAEESPAGGGRRRIVFRAHKETYSTRDNRG